MVKEKLSLTEENTMSSPVVGKMDEKDRENTISSSVAQKMVEKESENTMSSTVAEKMEEKEGEKTTSLSVAEKMEEKEGEKTISLSVVEKMEADIEIKASPQKFHEMITHKPYHISNVSTDKIHACEIHEGDWGIEGSVICWNYTHDGEKRVAKELIEHIDLDKNKIVFKVIDGDLLKEYKSFKLIIQVSPKVAGEGSVVHWILEYEKISDEISHPETLLQFLKDLSKDIDAHLSAEE